MATARHIPQHLEQGTSSVTPLLPSTAQLCHPQVTHPFPGRCTLLGACLKIKSALSAALSICRVRFPLQIHPLHSPVPQGISAGYGNKRSPWRRSWELICLCLCPWEVIYTWLSAGKCRMLPGTAQEHSQVPGLGTKQRNLQPWWRGSSSFQHK